MRRVLAVDGGQSAIRVRHSDLPETVELEGVSRLEGDTVGAVAAAVVQGWRRSGALSADRVVLGLSTAPTDASSRWQLCEMVATGLRASEVWLADDAVTSHAGALSTDWGISITVGTGVACLAAPREGTPAIIGGHGYLIGDEGGAFWIGSAGLRAVLKALDGRGPSTALVGPAERHFDGLDDLGVRLHDTERPVDSIARFAPDVLAAAGAGDAVAGAITDTAADELAALARAAAHRVSPHDGPMPLALGGRLMEPGLLRARVEQRLAGTAPTFAVRSADGSPLEGALMLGAADDPGRYRDFVYIWEGPA